MPGTNNMQLNIESVSAVTSSPSTTLGERRIENGKEYLYCYNASTNLAADQGKLVMIEDGAEYTFTISTYSDAPALGVVSNATITTGAYGWVQTRGSASLSSATVSYCTAWFCLGATGAPATCSGTTNPAGILREAASGSTAVKVYFR